MVLALFPCDDIWRSTSTEDENVKISSTRNPIFTEGWKAYLYNADKRIKRRREPVKQMLEYRGGWKNNKTSVKSSMDPDASFSSSESCVSYFQDVDEVFSHMLISDSSMQQIIGDGPSVQTKREEHYRNKSGRRRKQQNRVRERLCRFCYDQYVSVCEEIGYEVVDIHSYGIWRGHSIRNSTGKVTCPHLWFIRCQHCGAAGDCAHPSYDCPFTQHSEE